MVAIFSIILKLSYASLPIDGRPLAGKLALMTARSLPGK
jgi:hypothetical protein